MILVRIRLLTMQIENALKMLSPRGVNFLSSSSNTSLDKIKPGDVLLALSMASAKASLGINILLAKLVEGGRYQENAIVSLMQFIEQNVPDRIRKAGGASFMACNRLLAQFVLMDYCRSAASSCYCPQCMGKGRLSQPTDEGSRVTICPRCAGKGSITARCRCGGRGEIQDRKLSRERGVPIYKKCERCSGRGYALLPSTMVYGAIKEVLPDLHARSWSRNWKPFYEYTIAHCYKEEGVARRAFREVMNG